VPEIAPRAKDRNLLIFCLLIACRFWLFVGTQVVALLLCLMLGNDVFRNNDGQKDTCVGMEARKLVDP